MRTRSSARTVSTSKVLSSGRRIKNVNYSDLDAAKSEEPAPTKKHRPSYHATKEPSSARLAAHHKTVEERKNLKDKKKQDNNETNKKKALEEVPQNENKNKKQSEHRKHRKRWQ